MLSRLPGEIKKRKKIHMIFPDLLPCFENLTLRFCKCDISKSIIARGLKLYQLIDDEE